jgi:hypothetical protein
MTEENEKLFAYFVEQTNKKLDEMDRKLDDLFVFKWKVVGMSSLACFVVTALVEMFFKH